MTLPRRGTIHPPRFPDRYHDFSFLTLLLLLFFHLIPCSRPIGFFDLFAEKQESGRYTCAHGKRKCAASFGTRWGDGGGVERDRAPRVRKEKERDEKRVLHVAVHLSLISRGRSRLGSSLPPYRSSERRIEKGRRIQSRNACPRAA